MPQILISSVSIASQEMLMIGAWEFDCKHWWYLLMHFSCRYFITLNTSIYIISLFNFQLRLHFALYYTYMSDTHVHTSQCEYTSVTNYLDNYKNAAHASPLKWCCLGNWLYPSLASLIPIPSFNTSRGKRSLVNTVQHFCASMEFSWHNLIGWLSDYLICTGLTYHKPFSFTHHTLTDLLSTPSNLLKHSKEVTIFTKLPFLTIYCGILRLDSSCTKDLHYTSALCIVLEHNLGYKASVYEACICGVCTALQSTLTTGMCMR